MKIAGKGYGGGASLSNMDMVYASSIVNIANICLLIALIFVYGKSYCRLKSNFTLGFLLFSFLLLLQNLLFLIFLLFHSGFRGPGMGIPLLIINTTQFIALLILLKITWK
ncbi:MAG: hypothetical protein QME14_02305 [Methanobacteriaceae archaeon]|nr:hypothetical protein [Methanobacteriaceae archaeon]